MARFFARLPRGGFTLTRALAWAVPQLQQIALPTELGPFQCDLRLNVCYPLLKCGGYPHTRREDDYLSGLIGPSDKVLDVGANIGWLTRLCANRGASVLALEPSPRALRLLRLNCEGAPNVSVVACAASSVDGDIDFVESARLDRSRVGASERAIKVRAITIDTLVAERQFEPTLLKIDVEGHEREVLMGAQATLSAYRPLVFIEALSRRELATSMALIQSAGDYSFMAFSADGLSRFSDADEGFQAALTSNFIAEPAR